MQLFRFYSRRCNLLVTLEFADASAHSEELDLVIGAFKFLLKALNLTLLIHDLLEFRVHINGRCVTDASCTCSIVQCRDILIDVDVNWR